MIEMKQKQEFYQNFIMAVEDKAKAQGSKQTPFLEDMLVYMGLDDEPSLMYFAKKELNIQINGYSYNEDDQVLNLFVVKYETDSIDEQTLPKDTMTELKDYASKAKRLLSKADLLLQYADPSQEIYDLLKLWLDKRATLNEINLYVATNHFYESNKPIDISVQGIATVNVHIWDMERIYRLTEAEQGNREFEITLAESLEMQKIPNEMGSGVIDCYIGAIPALVLAELYETWGPKLVERNVRSFLQARGGTNKGIRDTLKDEQQRELFVAYNNGISSVAKSGDIEQVEGTRIHKVKSLVSWQIVNGGQTTASIHQAYKNGVDLTGVYVQAKLTILNAEKYPLEKDSLAIEDELIAKISEYANTQNTINKSDLLANTRFMSDLELLSRKVWIPVKSTQKETEKWYFERARGQYMVDIGRRKRGKEQTEFKRMFPKDKVITKVDLAKYFMSWEGYPYVSSKGGEEAFKKFMEFNAKYWKTTAKDNEDSPSESLDTVDELFYKELIARRIINHFVNEVVREMKLKGYRANVLYYTVAMLNHLYGQRIDLMDIWRQQELSAVWKDTVRIIASNALNYLRESAQEQNVTQWAKKEACWQGFKEEYSTVLNGMI